MKLLDPDDPFFARPWVRWVTVLLPTGWGLAELFWIGSPMWGVLFLAAGAYAAWALLLNRKGD
ncbi:hypothetical protein [Tabrizicola sp.]|uniref:hypothetical protein n=1 Tax=Tabrizicola sp. TaxID=2005166 RepID=UPI00263889AF|nr:hypothetical protein [Tabrizicola sp.]MDM7932817.1 hypothetical protein [Tabrizicola sp.]